MGTCILVQSLLDDLARECAGTVTRVVLTLNIPEGAFTTTAGAGLFVPQIRRSGCPLGFGANPQKSALRCYRVLRGCGQSRHQIERWRFFSLIGEHRESTRHAPTQCNWTLTAYYKISNVRLTPSPC